MKTKSIIAFGLLISTYSFSQNIGHLKFSSPIINNPALTGLKSDQELNLKFSHMYSLNNLYVDYNAYSKKLHGGFGVYSNSGRFEFGKVSFNNFGLSYAYQKKLNNNWNYSAGASFELKSLKNTLTSELRLDYDFNIGGLLYTDKFYTSLSINNISSIGRNYNLGFGYKLTPFANKDLSFTPSINFKYQFNNLSTDVNLTMKHKNLMFGAGYNYNKFSTNIGYDFKRFKLNYSFGNLQNSFTKYNSHEFSIQLKLGDLNKTNNRIKFNHNLF